MAIRQGLINLCQRKLGYVVVNSFLNGGTLKISPLSLWLSGGMVLGVIFYALEFYDKLASIIYADARSWAYYRLQILLLL